MKPVVDPSFSMFLEVILSRKVIAPVLIDVKDLTSVADAFLICSGSSNRQVTAIAEHVRRDLKKKGIKPLSVEGEKDGHWVLMDYGHLIIHIFYEPMRNFYDLEGLWIDAPRIDIGNLSSRAGYGFDGENDGGDT